MIELKGEHQSVTLKYRKLCKEIDLMKQGKEHWSNIDHTLSKLGIFVDDLLRDYQRIAGKLQDQRILHPEDFPRKPICGERDEP